MDKPVSLFQTTVGSTIILGIDPGSRKTGYGIVEWVPKKTPRYISAGSIESKAKEPFYRLKEIFDRMSDLVFQFSPQVLAVEQIFFHQNVRSVLTLGQARGVAVVAALTHHRLPIFEYAPRLVKQTVVGYGAASKYQIQQMIRCLLHLDQPVSEDASDALAVALCHAQHAQLQWLQRPVSESIHV